MAKVLLACYRSRKVPDGVRAVVDKIVRRLKPDHIEARPDYRFEEDGLLLVVQNPVEGMLLSRGGVCQGMLLEAPADWPIPGAATPEGSFALYRSDARTVELVSDAVASRTIWYAQTPEVFLASSSQRAIIALLGDFDPNPQAVTWMVSSGSLGPENSWDRRLRCLKPASRLRLDRDAWTIQVEQREAVFQAEDLPVETQRIRLMDDLAGVFERFHPDPARWVGLLSGGYDSRAILASLKERDKYRFITWGVEAARKIPQGDAEIARELAEYFRVRHEYLVTDLASDEPAETVLERFSVAGEGRVDHISGYADGFRIWKDLFDGGTAGVIRGDEGFGWHAVNSAFAVRYSLGAILFSDIANLGSPAAVGLDGFPAPSLPEAYRQQTGETLATWRDRLYHEFRLPVVLAALNDLKSAYVEISNPLLSRCLIERVRSLPDDLRTDKLLWKMIVRDMVPSIDTARRAAIESGREILATDRMREVMVAELSRAEEQNALPRAFLQRVLTQIQTDGEGRPGRVSWRTRIAGLLPKPVKRALKRTGARPDLDPYQLAFRTYLICRMQRLIAEDLAVARQEENG